jgi:hypothetical protein
MRIHKRVKRQSLMARGPTIAAQNRDCALAGAYRAAIARETLPDGLFQQPVRCRSGRSRFLRSAHGNPRDDWQASSRIADLINSFKTAPAHDEATVEAGTLVFVAGNDGGYVLAAGQFVRCRDEHGTEQCFDVLFPSACGGHWRPGVVGSFYATAHTLDRHHGNGFTGISLRIRCLRCVRGPASFWRRPRPYWPWRTPVCLMF